MNIGESLELKLELSTDRPSNNCPFKFLRKF